MIFEGFEGPFSQSKSIKNRFQVELAMKCAPRRPQDNPKTRLRRPKTPKTAPRRAQDAPRTPPGRPKTPPRSGTFGAQKRIFSGPPPNLDFGASWARFWEVLASILGCVEVDFLNILGIGFGIFFGHPKGSRTHKETKVNQR